MKKVMSTLFISLLISSCGGGGGSSSGDYTVEGKFISSYVQGLKVCTKDMKYCTQTDRYGNFSIKSTSKTPEVVFFIRDVELGEYSLKENGETVTPFKLSQDNQAGDAIAKIIHALGNDTDGTKKLIDLSNIKVEANPNIESILSAVERKEDFTLNVNGGNYLVKVSFPEGKPQVELCKEGKCTPVNYRQWLVLILMAADNDLNNYAYDDLDEISQVKFNPQVKVIAVADLYGRSGTIVGESSEETGEFETYQSSKELNTGSGYTVREIVKTFEDKYPSSKVALIFWDHGDGWRSSRFAAIDKTDNSYLFMYRLVNALKELQREGYKVNFIGFDECLMGMEEVFFDVGQFSDAVVASEALEPGTGWNYTYLFRKIVENPSVDPYQFGKLVVDAYREAYRNQDQKTIIVLSKEEIEKLTSAINKLYYRLSTENFQYFYQARENSVVVPDSQNQTLYHVDLYSFASQLKDKFPEAQEITSIIENAYKFLNDPNLKGISIYFPPTSESDDSYPCYLLDRPSTEVICFEDPNYYNPFAVNLWDDFLTKYYYLLEDK